MDRDYTKNPLRVITTFSGYDSQCLAMDRMKQNIPGFDYELIRWCEIDPNAIKGHNQCYPQWADRNLGDITKVDWAKVKEDVGDIDMFTCSSPCQDFSCVGRMRGGEKGSGTRSSLLWECEKAIMTIRPKMFLMENVKNLVSKKFKPLFFRWMDTLSGMGYHCFWKVLNAKDFGVPQNRERVFMVSIRDDIYKSPFIFPTPFPLKKKLKDVLEKNVDDKYYLSETSIDGFRKHNENHEKKGTGFIWRPKDVESVIGGDK